MLRNLSPYSKSLGTRLREVLQEFDGLCKLPPGTKINEPLIYGIGGSVAQ